MFKKIISAVIISVIGCSTAYSADKNMPFADVALDIYRTAVETRTVSGYKQVPVLANYLADKFKAGGFANEDVHVLMLGDLASLVVRYRGDGSSGKKPISISAHMDVVEALKKDWTRDPFKLIEEDGYFFGRGTLDNKAGMTAVVTNFLRLKSEGWVPNRDLIIAFSGDEESGMLTTRALVSEHRKLIDSEFVLNADSGGGVLPEGGGLPTSFGMQAAEKTYTSFDITVKNVGGHSSRPRDDNAIYELADALKKIQHFKFPVLQNELTQAYFKSTGKNLGGTVGEAMVAFANDKKDQSAIDVLRADPGIVGTLGTTCIATMLRGGHAENALPQSATATINCRIFPENSVEQTQATLINVIGNDNVEFTILADSVATDPSPLRDDIFKALTKAIDTNYKGLEIIPNMSSGGTDGMHFRAAGIPSYGVGGVFMKSSDVFAHGLNERIPVKSFYDNLQHWYVLLKAIAG
jgi:carboxypeptidase PM20D1